MAMYLVGKTVATVRVASLEERDGALKALAALGHSARSYDLGQNGFLLEVHERSASLK